MKTYKYQMHAHTAPPSKCGAMSPEELVEKLYEDGYAGCVLTNHFYGGNTGIDRSLPWEEFIDCYERDYLCAKRAAQKYGIDIIFGIEEHLYGGKEIIPYGITPKILRSHPELALRDPEIWIKTLHAYGLIAIQAHPYRKRAYITEPGPLPLCHIDGIEVYNAANPPEENAEAEAFAALHKNLILTSGADAHKTATLTLGGIETAERIPDGEALVRILKSGNYRLLDKTE